MTVTQQRGSQPVFAVREDYVRVPMRDGVYLHARLWRPLPNEPLPVVINYDPYRPSDGRTLGRGHVWEYLARHGFVFAHLAVRGTDASEGIATDEYVPVEQTDGYDAIQWFAAQPWCNGSVGMMGTSYSGFTAIQVATLQPPHLKAIVPLLATDDRYTDDIHYRGGTLHTFNNLETYGAMMGAMNALPPLPEHAGERWMDEWMARLEQTPLWMTTWLEHQTDGPYWRAASLRSGYDRVRCPVFVWGGWLDAYRTATLRMFQHLSVPKKCVIGPWTHTFPDDGHPGPNVDFMGMVVRWFDYWLKDIDTGIMDEPPLLVYMQEHAPPHPSRTTTPGFWRAEEAFPVAGATEQILHLGSDGALVDHPDVAAGTDRYEYKATVGTQDMVWGGCVWAGAPADQRPDEIYSLVYTSSVLSEPVHILGDPRAILHFASTAPLANLACKLADVVADGSSALVTSGVLNVTHRDSHEHPEPLTPGQIYEVTVELDATGYVFAPGHRIRLAVSSSDWPNTWPSPDRATNSISYGGAHPSRLTLPRVPQKEADQAPEMSPPRLPANVRQLAPTPYWEVARNMRDDRASVTVKYSRCGSVSETLDFREEHRSVLTASDAAPAMATCDTATRLEMRRPTETIASEGQVHFTSSHDAFHLAYDLTVTIDGRERYVRRWRRSFPRRLV